MTAMHIVPSAELAHPRALRAMLADAFDGGFRESDWQHALGGWHVVVEEDRQTIAHAAIVERTLVLGETEVRAAYVEAVATARGHRGRGHGAAVMQRVGAIVEAGYALGGLSAGIPGFYERFGWRLWRGPTFVRRGGERLRTPADDGTVMVLATATSPAFDVEGPIACTWRPGDVW